MTLDRGQVTFFERHASNFGNLACFCFKKNALSSAAFLRTTNKLEARVHILGLLYYPVSSMQVFPLFTCSLLQAIKLTDGATTICAYFGFQKDAFKPEKIIWFF